MDRTALTHCLLFAYSGVLTIVLCVVLLIGAASHKNTIFDQIDVERINVVEPDGTVRLVISDKVYFPGLVIKGKEYPYDRHTAGMIFFNDEGTENGGLIFGGMKNKDGQPESYGHLSFDKYMGDQLMAVESGQQGGRISSGIDFIDDADIPMSVITDALQEAAKLPPDQRNAKMTQALKGQPKSEKRVHLGRNPDESSSLELKDKAGHNRIVLRVAADGTPTLQLLDEQGKVTSEFPAKAR